MSVGVKSSPQQIIAGVLDVTNQAIKTTMVGTEVAIAVSAADSDSVITWSGDRPHDYDSYSRVLSGANTVVTTQYFTGGLAGTLVGTTVETFSDNTRTFLVSYVKS
jgi:hypothetical protein